MDGRMEQAVDRIMSSLHVEVKAWAERAEGVDDPASAEVLELRIQEQGRRALAGAQQELMQARLDQRNEADRVCPSCGGRRRHKGRQTRHLLGVLGPIRLEPVYWRCPACGDGGSALRRLASGRISGPMRELLALAGTAWGGFAKGAQACRRLLGVKVNARTIARHCRAEGRRALEWMPGLAAEDVARPLRGSCDGTWSPPANRAGGN